MNPLHTVFLHARELSDPAERAAYLDQACTGDADVRARLEALLADQTAADAYFDDFETQESPAPRPSVPVVSTEVMPEQIGSYRILESIGHGGMGDVYRAEQRQPIRREVALKVIKLGMDTRQVVARFEAERQALALMDHPHIARVYDAGADERGRPYFAMEYVKGVPVTEYADRNRLTVKDRLQLFRQVCQAIQHAHQKGVIHRDIKPGNVLVSTQDGRPFAKVIDFGIAKATAQQLTDKTLFTLHDQFIGTPQYMSPEQATGSLDIDTRSDVYSLGVLLYELLTGRPPFDTEKLKRAALHEIVRILREEEPPAPSTRLHTLDGLPTAPAELRALAESRSVDSRELVRQVRGELDWLVMKAMEKDRMRRYASPGELVEDVESYLSGAVLKAAPPTLRYRAGKFVRAHRTGVIFGAAALGLLLLAITGTSMGLLREREAKREALAAKNEAQESQRQAEKSRNAVGQKNLELESRVYAAALQAASNAVEAGDAEAALAALESCPERLRDWEWKVLFAAADSTLTSFAFPEGFKLVESSPEGEYAVLRPDRGDDRSLLLWRASDGRETARIHLPEVSEVLQVAISDTAARVAVLGLNHAGPEPERKVTLYVWDRLQEKITWKRSSSGSEGMVFGDVLLLSGNGKSLVVGGIVVSREKWRHPLPAERKWDPNDPFSVQPPENPRVYLAFEIREEAPMVVFEGDGPSGSFAISPDGNSLIASWPEAGKPEWWDVTTGKLRARVNTETPPEAESLTDDLQFSGESYTQFISVNAVTGKTTVIFDAGEVGRMMNDIGVQGTRTLASFAHHDPRSGLLVYHSRKANRVHVEYLEEDESGRAFPEAAMIFTGARGAIRRVRVDQEARRLYAYSDSHASCFPLPSRTMATRLSSARSMAELAGWGSSHLLRRSPENGSVTALPGRFEDQIDHWPFRHDVQGFILKARTTWDSSLEVYRAEGKEYQCIGKLPYTAGSLRDECVDAVCAPDGKWTAVSYGQMDSGWNALRLYETRTGELSWEIRIPVEKEGASLLGFSRGHLWILANGIVSAVCLQTGAKVDTLPAVETQAAAISPNGSALACISGREMSLLQLPSLSVIRSWKVPRGAADGITWANGRRILCGGRNALTVCDAVAGAVLFEKPVYGMNEGRPDERYILGEFGFWDGWLSIEQFPRFPVRPLRERWPEIEEVDRLETDPGELRQAAERIERLSRSDLDWAGIAVALDFESMPLARRFVTLEALVKTYGELYEKAEEVIGRMPLGFPTASYRKILEREPDRRLRRMCLERLDKEDTFPWSSAWSRLDHPESCREVLENASEAIREVPGDIECEALIGAALYRAGDYGNSALKLRAIPWVGNMGLVDDWRLHSRLMSYLAMAEFRLGNREAADVALQVALMYSDMGQERFSELQKEAAGIVRPDRTGAVESTVATAREGMVGELLKQEEEARRRRTPAVEPMDVEVRGKVTQVIPTRRGDGARLVLDSYEKGVNAWIDFGKVKDLDLSRLARLEGKMVTIGGKGGIDPISGEFQVAVKKAGQIREN